MIVYLRNLSEIHQVRKLRSIVYLIGFSLTAWTIWLGGGGGTWMQAPTKSIESDPIDWRRLS